MAMVEVPSPLREHAQNTPLLRREGSLKSDLMLLASAAPLAALGAANTPSMRREPSLQAVQALQSLQASEPADISSQSPQSCLRTAKTASVGTPPKGRGRAVRRVSGAERLRLLAAAFKLCPAPTPDEVAKLAVRLDMKPHELVGWFTRRQLLEGWVQRCPWLTEAHVAELLARSRSTTPSPVRPEAAKEAPIASSIVATYE